MRLDQMEVQLVIKILITVEMNLHFARGVFV